MPWELKSDRPVYLQLVEQIKRKIIAGDYPPGSQVPPVRTLAEEAGVNPNTMQKALAELERDGLVYTLRTSGRYITEDSAVIQKAKYFLAKELIADFLQHMTELGFERSEIIQLIKQEEGQK